MEAIQATNTKNERENRETAIKKKIMSQSLKRWGSHSPHFNQNSVLIVGTMFPVLKRVYDSFGDKMNTDFVYVMALLLSEQPWYRFLHIDNSFSKAKPLPPNVSIPKLLSMSSYALGSYLTDQTNLATFLGLSEEDVVYFNSRSSIKNPACFLAVNHHSRELDIQFRSSVGLSPVFVERSPN